MRSLPRTHAQQLGFVQKLFAFDNPLKAFRIRDVLSKSKSGPVVHQAGLDCLHLLMKLPNVLHLGCYSKEPTPNLNSRPGAACDAHLPYIFWLRVA